MSECCELKNLLAENIEEELQASGMYRNWSERFAKDNFPDLADIFRKVSEDEFTHYLFRLAGIELLRKECSC